LCAAGSEHAKETDRAGSGMVYYSAHVAVDPSVAVDVFAADLTEDGPVFLPRATSTARIGAQAFIRRIQRWVDAC
jgi:hypothetical protein